MRGYFLMATTFASFVFWVACAVIFNYDYYCEFLFSGRRARLLFKLVRLLRVLVLSSGVRGSFLIITTMVSFVLSGSVSGYF